MEETLRDYTMAFSALITIKAKKATEDFKALVSDFANKRLEEIYNSIGKIDFFLVTDVKIIFGENLITVHASGAAPVNFMFPYHDLPENVYGAKEKSRLVIEGIKEKIIPILLSNEFIFENNEYVYNLVKNDL